MKVLCKCNKFDFSNLNPIISPLSIMLQPQVVKKLGLMAGLLQIPVAGGTPDRLQAPQT